MPTSGSDRGRPPDEQASSGSSGRSPIRLARPSDAEAVLSIYAPFVEGSTTSFELEVPTAPDMAARIARTLDGGLPYLVSTEANRVTGFAYAGLHRSRPAYAWSVETSVYLEPAVRGQGLGTSLMRTLLGLLERQGYRTVLAGVSLPNDASVALHTRLGFAPVGTYVDAGFKHGAWVDVWWGQLQLRHPRAPEAPLPLSSLGSDPLL